MTKKELDKNHDHKCHAKFTDFGKIARVCKLGRVYFDILSEQILYNVYDRSESL